MYRQSRQIKKNVIMKIYTVWEDGIYTHIQNANCSQKRADKILEKTDHLYGDFKTAKAAAVKYLNGCGINQNVLTLAKSKRVYLTKP